MDRRQEKTRTAIFQAFYALLAQKKYSGITVQEIIDKANVGRSTFYAHFKTKDDLLKEMCTDLFDHIVNNHDESETTHDFSDKTDDVDAIVTHILYHLRDNRKNIVGILRGEGADLFLRYFKQYLNLIFKEQSKGRITNSSVPEDFLLNHISSSFVGMIEWWIRKDMKQSPEELARYFSAVMEPIL